MARKNDYNPTIDLIRQLEERVAHLENLGLPEDDFKNVPPTTPYTHVEEAISEWAGERCPDYEEGCATCDTWKEFDDLVERAESCGDCYAVSSDGVGFLKPYHPGDPKASEGTKTRIIQDHIDREAGYTVESVIKPDGRNDPLVHKKYEFVINRPEEIDGEVVPWMTRTDIDDGLVIGPYSERMYEMNHANTYKLLRIAEKQITHLWETLMGWQAFHHARADDKDDINKGLRKDLAGVRADRDRILKGYEDLLVQHEQVRAQLVRAENKLIIRS